MSAQKALLDAYRKVSLTELEKGAYFEELSLENMKIVNALPKLDI